MSAKANLGRGAAIASITTALFLVALKLWAVWQSNSMAMLGSLADSALDLVASLATLTGVIIAARPADRTHRFGHGKAEALAAIFQVMLIALSAAGIAMQSVRVLAEGRSIAAAEEGIAVSVIAILATFALLAYQRYVIARTRSVAIQADHVHYQSDLLLNLAVIAALVLERYAGLTGADPLFGLAIAFWLLWGAWRAAAEAIDHLMDREWSEEKRARFVAVVARHPELSKLHDLRTRTSGGIDFVQFHVDLPGDYTVEKAHDIIERVEQDLLAEFPDAEVLIHVDPSGHVDEPSNRLVEEDQFSRFGERPVPPDSIEGDTNGSAT